MVASNGLFQSIDNFETGTRVEDALLAFNGTRFARISAVAFCGIVELTGAVTNYFDKSLAMKIASQVEGVTTVIESIQILRFVPVARSPLQRRPRPVAFYRELNHDRTSSQRGNRKA